MFADADLTSAELASHLEAVQREVVREEPGDRRRRLPRLSRGQRQVQGRVRDLGDVPMGERATLALRVGEVVRNLLRGLSNGDGNRFLGKLYGWIGNLVGTALHLLRWPVRAIWGQDAAVRRGLSLAILFAGLWGIVMLLLLALDFADATRGVWIAAAATLAVLLSWTLLMALARWSKR